jgi:hypothetical protein
MTRKVILLCLIGATALLATNAAAQPVQPFSGVVWTTKTLNSPAGKPVTSMQRTLYFRDVSGNVRREIYRPTLGVQHDLTAPLQRVITASTYARPLTSVQSSRETMVEDADLGTLQLLGLPATGRRQTFRDATGRRTHTLETWYSATLGMTVHTESRTVRGDVVTSDLSELRLGNPVAPSAESVSVASPTIPLLALYRGLFTHIAHMERDRQANDSGLKVNMSEIEDHLRKKISLSASEWQILVDKSVEVELYTRDKAKDAHTFVNQDREARRANPLSANTLVAGRAKLHSMQLDLNAHVQGEIEDLKAGVGPAGTERIEAYLHGPLAASTSIMPLKSAQLQAKREQAR